MQVATTDTVRGVGNDSGPWATYTFLFTDIEGSTRLWEQEGASMSARLEQHDSILRDVISHYHGQVVKGTGDGAYAVFANPVDACSAAIEVQRLLSAAGEGDDALRARMAIHTGAAEARDNDYFGPTLNRAARLMGIGHGCQILVSEATASLARDSLGEDVTLTDLGEHRLRDIVRPEHVFQLGAPGLPADFPALRSGAARRSNLPVQLTSFVGREAELARVRDALSEHRLVTITGTGGIGKTRLALEAAAAAGREFPHGVLFCDLASATSSEALAGLIGGVVGVTPSTGRSLAESVVESLGDQRVLLVVDNCEHVLDAVSELADMILRSCENVVLLATSREGLAIPGEQILAIGSLALPPRGASDARASDAVLLFLARAREVRPDLPSDDKTLATIIDICRRLDGIPLAIELAAARTQSLSVDDIDTLLGDRFALLSRGARTALARHQTLRAAIDWSFDLLDDAERTVMTRASTFAGGFTLDAATYVCGAPLEGRLAMLDRIDTLVRRSLLVAEPVDGETRYFMLETIRQYSGDHLATDDATVSANHAHLDWCVSLVRDAGEQMRGPDDAAWVPVILREVENIRTALRYAVSIDDLDAVTTLMASMPAGILWGSPLGGAIATLASEIAPLIDANDHPATAAIGALQALDACLRFDGEEGVAHAERSCELARRLGTNLHTGPWLALLLSSLIADRADLILPVSEEALALAIASDDEFAIAEWYGEHGIALAMAGRGDEALEFTEMGLRRAEEIGATNLRMRNNFLRGTALLFVSEDFSPAYPYLERAVELGGELGFNILFGGAAWAMLISTRGTADLPSAAAQLRDQLAAAVFVNHRGGIRFWASMAATVLSLAGDDETAARLIGSGRMLRVAASPVVVALWDDVIQRTRDNLGDQRFDALRTEAAAMTADAVTDFTIEALDRVARGGTTRPVAAGR